jgi:hypothetical protein
MTAPARRKRNAPPSPPWEKPKVCITNGASTNSETNKDEDKDTESGKGNSNIETNADSKTGTKKEKESGGGGGARKKRSSDGEENEDAAEEPAVNEDFSNYAEFLQLFMKLPTDVRHDIGHLLGPVNFTTLREKISGLIVGCTYKGGSCMGQK